MTEHSKYYYEKDRNGWTTTSTEDNMTPEDRKKKPVYTGVIKYFPDALLEVAKCSFIGQQQHNPDLPLGWDRSKSGDELDALTRHLIDAGKIDTDGVRHSAKVAWRALANLQKEIENEST
tara:strand:+ start:437 stop:796 length:360 start_codon:yes stop_codon:yes gene_type:complete